MLIDSQDSKNVRQVGARIGIDVGGTFTDFVLFDGARGALKYHKQPSTPEDPSRAVADGLTALLGKAGLPPGAVAMLMHGTTIGLNAIIQRRGARIGFIATRGYRDVFEIGRGRMPSSFNFHATRETPLVPRSRVIEIGARVSPEGTPTQRPDEAELDRVAVALQALHVEAAALMLINGYANPEFEAGIAAALQERVPEVSIASAAAIWPEIREYERSLVAGLNVTIQPLMQRYLARLRERVRELGIDAPIFITASNGGSLSFDSALARPIDTVLSGPAAGVMAATRLAQHAGVERIISFDMGGTSSDIAVSVGGVPEIATRTEIGGLPLVLPVIAVSAIGAGGGSHVWVDEHGVLKVGPESAGADPGPVAYGRGGTIPTVTDCYLATGIIDPARFLGGAMPLDRQAAENALADVARRIGFVGEHAVQRAAFGALSVATARMATELYKGLAQRGLEATEFALVPYGGAGPTHGTLLAAEAGLSHIVVPPTPGTYCALGAVASDLRRDFVRSLRKPLNAASVATLAGLFDALATAAREWLDAERAALAGVELAHAIDMRYTGQAYELRVPLDWSAIERAGVTAAPIAEAFHREHERVYGFMDPDAPIEIGTVRLSIVGRMPVIELPTLAERDGRGGARPDARGARRAVFLADGWIDAAVIERRDLLAEDQFDGPAIVEQEDTTLLVLPGWRARVDTRGNLHLTKESRA